MSDAPDDNGRYPVPVSADDVFPTEETANLAVLLEMLRRGAGYHLDRVHDRVTGQQHTLIAVDASQIPTGEDDDRDLLHAANDLPEVVPVAILLGDVADVQERYELLEIPDVDLGEDLQP